MTLLYSILLFVLSGSAALAAENNLFEQANRAYEQGKYTEAASICESMLKAGYHSAGVLFNLGNALFKSGETGRAIYYYERAAELDPRDPDIQANLKFARDRVSGSVSISEPFWKHAIDYFTLNEITIATAILFWLWLGILTLLRWRPELRPSLRTPLGLSFSLLVLACVALALGCAARSRRTAVVIQKQAPVHLGPLPESQLAFTAPDGTELRVEGRRDGWLEVTDRSSRTGWVETNQVAVLGGI